MCLEDVCAGYNGVIMKIKLASVMVDDQAKALAFYTHVLGFIKKTDIPEIRWLTVCSAESPDEIELLLEPNEHPAAKTFQQALFVDGIPLTIFFVDDIHQEYQRMKDLGVVFRGEPTEAGAVTVVMFEDTCGNLIQLCQV